MVSGYVALGILCILYYCTISWHTKKINSTFSWFWILLALWNVVLAVLTDLSPDWLDYGILGFNALCMIVFVIVELIIMCAMVSLQHKNLDYIIVLGAQIRGRVITGTLKRRLDKALVYLQKNAETLCIVSGGQGRGEAVSEAQAMADYLIANGIAEERVILENQSKSTYENLVNCLEIIDEPEQDKVGIVTNNFHIYRATKYAQMIGYKKVYSIVASCDMILFLNYMVREFFAVLKMFKNYKNKNK